MPRICFGSRGVDLWRNLLNSVVGRGVILLIHSRLVLARLNRAGQSLPSMGCVSAVRTDFALNGTPRLPMSSVN